MDESCKEIMASGPEMSDAEIDEALMENVRLGYMEITGEKDGHKLFRLTELGEREAQKAILENINPESDVDVQ